MAGGTLQLIAMRAPLLLYRCGNISMTGGTVCGFRLANKIDLQRRMRQVAERTIGIGHLLIMAIMAAQT